jgi:hypothetical protein
LKINQIEAAVWSIYLDRYIWRFVDNRDLDQYLLFSAFASKTYLNDNFQQVNESIVRCYGADFNVKYNEWLATKHSTMKILLAELNGRFQELNTTHEDYIDNLEDI